jgi:Ni,Fe-hydrogenase III large subunit/Ni,Fe-hydrogenase III component G
MLNASATELGRVPALAFPKFREAILNGVTNGMRVAALFGEAEDSSSQVRLFVVLADSVHGQLRLAQTLVEDDRFESLTPDCPQLHLFEREIAEQFGVRPDGHPWFKPVRFQASWRPGHDAWQRAENDKPVPGVMDFYRVEGEEIHEVAVGPVHAGVIEPGHFRFQCHGEHVFHLEISLGYQHRGVERALCGGPNQRSIHYMETLAGDTTVGHAMAYSQVIEALAGCQVPIRGQILRGVALELERLANHTGDLGAMAGDVGYLPTASYCGRLRGDFLNITALLCGSRFGRGMVRPGGVGFDVDGLRIEQILQRLELAYRDVTSAVNLLWDSPSVQSRFEDTGAISPQIAEQLGLVGPSARACGLALDVRQDFPTGVFQFSQVPVSTWHTGDVFARAFVRWLEIQNSVAFLRDQLRTLPPGSIRGDVNSLSANRAAVALVEGWRGEICHVALTDEQGRFARYKVVDPSFHNWMGLAMALRDQQISDFPLCNKSFNLSYCGHDL